MGKKITKSSGLSDVQPPRSIKKKEKKKSRSKSDGKSLYGFRIPIKDREILADITISVEELTYSKISDTQTIRALMHLGRDIEPSVILKKIRDISV